MDLGQAQEVASQLIEILQAQQTENLVLIQERQLLEQSYKYLTVDSAVSFNGLFARMQYYNDVSAMPENLVGQLNSLRILCNKVAHDEIQDLAEGSSRSGALAIYRLLQHAQPGFSDEILDDLLKTASPFMRRPASRKTSFSCILVDWKYQEQAGRRTALELTARNDEGQELCIILRDDLKNPQKAKYTSLYPSLWKYAQLNCHNLSLVAGKEHFYIDNPNTLVVLEPDFLLDSSAVAECMDADSSQPELFLLSRLFTEPSSDKMLLGQMVNSMFDALIHDPQTAYQELFKDALNAHPIPMVALGADAALSIYHSIEKDHLPQLQSYSLEMADKDLLLEPSYLCPTYGLQGRLDLLYRENRKFSIVELKSGKAHPQNVWPQQIYQVVAYNMIIRNAYGAENLGQSSILYSSHAQNSLRNVANIPLLEQQLIHCRNRIVGIMHLLTEDPGSFFYWFTKQKAADYKAFNQEKLLRLQRLFNGLRDYEIEWFMEQVKRLSREIWQVKLGSSSPDTEKHYGHNSLWQLSLAEKTGKIISQIKVETCNHRILNLSLPLNQDVTDYRVGDIVLLYDASRRIDQQEIIRGVIESMDQSNITLKIRAGIKNQRRFGDKCVWALEHDILESFLYAPFSSLSSFLEADPGKRDLLYGLCKPGLENESNSGTEIADILDRMANAKDIHIIQGPPGTGKTSGLLSRYIQNFFTTTKKRMLVLSFTNRAVDEICLCLKRMNIPFIRMGNSSVIKEELLEDLIQDQRYAQINAILNQNRIYVSTVQAANASILDLQSIIEIDEMIVDEASQILEPAILGLISKVRKCILIGDQNQLPAISAQSSLPYQFKHPNLSSLHYGSINQSLMERLYNRYQSAGWQEHTDMLRTHYRMHDEIAALVAATYNNLLESARDSQKQALEEQDSLEMFNKRLLWIECPASTEDYYDPLQVQIINKLIQSFQAKGYISDPERDLGIVAPFRAMIYALRKELKGFTIDTVERFQGSERRIIILCLPLRKASMLKNLQSLNEDGQVDRKLNVALSRAIDRLIIVGNSSICRKAKHFNDLYKHIRANGIITNYQEIGVTNGKPNTSEPTEHQD